MKRLRVGAERSEAPASSYKKIVCWYFCILILARQPSDTCGQSRTTAKCCYHYNHRRGHTSACIGSRVSLYCTNWQSWRSACRNQSFQQSKFKFEQIRKFVQRSNLYWCQNYRQVVTYRHGQPNPDSHSIMRVRIRLTMSVHKKIWSVTSEKSFFYF